MIENSLQDKIKILEKENQELIKLLEIRSEEVFIKDALVFLRKSIKEHEKHEEQISELLSATHNILETNDFTTTAKQIFDSCARMIGAKAGYVALLSDDGHENELLFLEDGGMECSVDTNLPMPIRGLREESYRTGKVVYDNDFMKSAWVKYMPPGHMDLRNVLFSPLNIDGKTVGIMGMACKDRDFDENDGKIATAYGNYAAIALRNSKMIEELKSANLTKDKFFSIIAHDLKSPFNLLKSFSELLVEELNEQNYSGSIEYAGYLNETIDRTLNLLNQLLEWSLLQRGKIEINPEIINVRILVQDIQEMFEHAADLKSIRIICNIDKTHEVFADRKMIYTILRNIVSNSIKFTQQGGVIELTSEIYDQNYIKFSINDNGIGIKEENISKLFKVEHNVSTKGTLDEKGTGLGLMLCSEFVKLNKGKIGVDSKFGEGTCFWFVFPIPTIS